MEDIPTETIEKYLRELGFEDITDEQIGELKQEIQKRLQQEQQQNKNSQHQQQQSKATAQRTTSKTYSSEQESSELSNEEQVFKKSKTQSQTKQSKDQQSKKNQYVNQSSSDEEVEQHTPQQKRNALLKGSKDTEEDDEKYQPIEKQPIPTYQHKQMEHQKITNPYIQPRPMSSNSKKTTMVQLMGPNRHTHAEKQKQNADPVSRHMKYEQMWAIQGAPDQRRERQWKARMAALQLKQKEYEHKQQEYYE